MTTTRSMLQALVAALLLTPLVHMTPALADQAAVTSKLEAYLVNTDKKGKERMAPAARVNPGQIIEYRLSYKNRSGQALSGFVVSGPIPKGTAFVGKSARLGRAATFEVLVPSEKWQALPAFKSVKGEAGKSKRVRATAADYKALRWRLKEPIQNGKATSAIYRVRVLK